MPLEGGLKATCGAGSIKIKTCVLWMSEYPTLMFVETRYWN